MHFRRSLNDIALLVVNSKFVLHSAFLLEKKFKVGGGGAKDHRPLFFKTIGYFFYCSFYCFFENFRGQTPFLGGPCPPCSRKPALRMFCIPKRQKIVCQRSSKFDKVADYTLDETALVLPYKQRAAIL